MKKIFSLLLVLTMILSLCACGKQPTMQSLQANAEKITHQEISNNTFENIANAKSLYCDKNLEITGKINSIGEDHFMFGDLSEACVKVFLDANTLASLETYQQITVVGKTDDKVHTESKNIMGIPVKTTIYTMKPAYIVTEMYDITGNMQTYKYKDGYLLKTSDNKRYVVYFKNDENLDALNQTKQINIPITVTGKILYSSSSGSENIIKEATIKN